MRYISAVHTDIGISKKINQDSVLLKAASTGKGNVILAAVCDGMGGMARGEVASATFVRGLSTWFKKKLPKILFTCQSETERRKELSKDCMYLTNTLDTKIAEYGEKLGDVCGTTAVILLIIENMYYIANVGDSRAYLYNEDVFRQITKDHTVVQRELDRGTITEEDAKTHPQRSVLLQCVGSGEGVQPDYFHGPCADGDLFLLCSDGLRNKASKQELARAIYPGSLRNEDDLKNAAIACTELVKKRKEKDNISAILIKCER